MKGEIRKMCKYCENYDTGNDFNPIASGEFDLGIFGKLFADVVLTPEGMSLMVCTSDTDLSYEDRIKIHYCPMCGRKLEED